MARPRKRGPAGAESPVRRTRHRAQTAPVTTRLQKQAHCGPPPGHWESLCPDVRRVVLSKVPLRALALAAGTCRELRGEFRKRLGEEQERLISLADASYGKDVVSGFVKSVQDSICGSAPYYDQLTEKNHRLVIDAAGELELVTCDQMMKLWHYLVIDAAGKHKRANIETVIRLLQNGCVPTFRHLGWGTHMLMTHQRNGLPIASVTISVMRTGAFRTHIKASSTGATGEAAMGIFLAICTRPHEPKLSRARPHSESPKSVPALIWGPMMRKEFKGPLGVLADTFFHYTL